MPADIRGFFGGKPQDGPAKEPQNKKDLPKRGRTKKVLDDSDDEVAEAASKKSTPKKAPSKKRAPTPDGEATSTADYFGSKKPKRAAAGKPKSGVPAVEFTPKAKESSAKSTPSKSTPSKSTPNGRSSARTKKNVNYAADDQDEDVKMLKEEEDDEKDDVFTTDYKNGGRGADDYEEDEDMKDVKPEEAEDDEDEKPAKGKKVPAAKGGRKRKSEALGDDDASPKKAKAPRKAKPMKEEAEDSAEMKAIFASIPTVRAPTPPPKDDEDGEGRKFNYRAGAANVGPAPAAGSKEIPIGADACLAGLTFVFTGLLQSIGRDDAQSLVKRYGGKITGAPSKKTSYVVLGADAGPSKLTKIKDLSIKTIDEDGLFELIRKLPPGGGDSKLAAEHKAKKDKDEAKIREMAAEAEAEDKMLKKAAGAKTTTAHTGGARANEKAPAAGPDSRLWTVKYAPTQLSQICGNKGIVEKLQRWLKNFPKNQRTGFKLAGPDGSGTYRAVIIHGPPGIGKTTAAHLVAKLEGYDIVESNASDTRSKKLVEAGLKGVLSTKSLMGYFAGDSSQVEASKRKLVLIMDEVDGMSAGDRGGVGALAAVCKKSKVPMILICNDRKLQKMKPFEFCTYDMPFRRPSADMIRSRIMTISYHEGLKLSANVIDALVEGSRADIRQVVNMISNIKLDQEAEGAAAFDFDSSKDMSKAWEKHVVLKSWDITSKILGGGLFAPTSRTTLNQKAELYFNDHDIAPLMLQENYLGTNPVLTFDCYDSKRKNLRHLELVEKAANSISDGDLVDRMIHGGEQHWALMPVHAIFSFVRPASFVAGSQAGHSTTFTQWLGKNSSMGKMQRQVKEIQGHMRLRASGDRHEIRQQYLPLLWANLVKKLEVEGKEAVPNVIELMDSYFLTKDDWDAIMDLGVGPMAADTVKIETQAKSTFTRLYNQASHPLPFMKASNVLAPKKAAKTKPDLEEALEESDEGEIVDAAEEEKPDAEDTDLSKDKYVKQPKKKKAAAASKGKGAKKGAAADDDDEAEEQPKKGKGKARAKK